MNDDIEASIRANLALYRSTRSMICWQVGCSLPTLDRVIAQLRLEGSKLVESLIDDRHESVVKLKENPADVVTKAMHSRTPLEHAWAKPESAE